MFLDAFKSAFKEKEQCLQIYKDWNLEGIIVNWAHALSKKEINELYKVALPCMQFNPYVYFIFVQ